MARNSALPPSLPPRLLTREAAAAYASVSGGTFDKMVGDGTMPKPRKISGTRIGWDVRELDAAIDALPHRGGDADVADASWSDVDAPQAAA